MGALMQEQKFAIEPQDQAAIVGSRATLPCRVINKSGFVQWTRDDFALGNHRNLSDYVRYSMTGTDEEGDFSLNIEPVQMEDDAKFQCQVGPGKGGEPGIRSRYAYLTVLVPPDRPEIIQGEQLTTTEDREIELECVSKGGKPAPEITWIDGLGSVVTKNAEYKTEPQPDKLVTARSILKVTPKKEHHNTTFMCQAQNVAERTYQLAKLQLFVKYAPKVTIKINSVANPPGNIWWNQLVEGMEVRISCHVDANPPEVNYRWYLNDTAAFPATPTELVISNISRDYHEAIVKCEAYNSVGKSEDSETLHVIYGPRFVHRPQSVQAETSTAVTLNCEVDGNPPPEISWIHEKFEKKLVGRTSNLTVRVTDETIGKYYCKAFTSGFPEISAEAYVYLKGRPIIRRQPIQFGIPGDSIRLDCIVYSIPMPERLTWSFNGREVGSENLQDYTVTDETTHDGVKSSLTVQNAKPGQFGAYNCTVFNKYGSDSVEIILKPQKSFPLLLVLIGILGCVVVVVTVILITILCQRKVKKVPPPPPAIVIDSEKQCKDSDRSSNYSDIKLEIRTGSSASNQNCEEYTGQDTDSVITRVGPLTNSLNSDTRYSINRFSSSDYPDPDFPPKTDGHNNNGYVPYVDYAKDYNPPASVHSSHTGSPSITATNFHATTTLDTRFSAAYGNPYLRSTNSPTSTLLPNGQPPPPPYCTLRNGHLPQLSRFSHSPPSQYIVAGKKGSLATHV